MGPEVTVGKKKLYSTRLSSRHIRHGCSSSARRLEIRQPKNTPGTAAGVKYGRTHRASEIRNWTGPKLMGRKAMVRTT